MRCYRSNYLSDTTLIKLEGCGPKGAEKILALAKIDEGTMSFRLLTLSAYVAKFGEDIGIQKFYETYMLVKLRTDIPTEDLDITEICHCYDLAARDAETSTQSQEPVEDIPDFTLNFNIDEPGQ